ncbi:hypothetical protein SAMN04487886_100157 [Clostridium sp. DSM 8431]|uniref:hypothetical protein n=1 Tax=Clostridium sp. DSM 8431 TaxID=1761781 RepID=UPI0008F41F4D|nr:hypothetical protein [Clostridium sp. DSM 8431]SFU28641.1 hypothetical protein SAMN04487886_100157 [Clostridium sp. DSM 8431]
MYIKRININFKNINEKKINNIIEEELGDEEKYLINYEISKKEKSMYLYYMMEGMFISRIARKLKEIEVIPIQVYFFKYLRKKIKKESFKCILYYSKTYYFINVHKGYLSMCYILHSINELEEVFNRIKDEGSLYVQRGIEFLEDNEENIIFLDCGGLYSEKIFL